jgi:APA family basic amino acid/polyamine antiporter
MSNKESIGLGALTALVTGNLVGSGVYMLPASLAAIGAISIGGWIATSVGAIFLALIFAELSSHTKLSGGPYQFARMAFGDTVGYFVCWSYWMLSWISNPALAVAAVGAMGTIWGPFSPLEAFLLELLIVVVLTSFNQRDLNFLLLL